MAVTNELISREAAAASGRKTYFTGEPCKHGHVSPRYTINAACIACMQKHRPRLNPFSHDKVPYAPAKPFWRSKRLTPEQLAQLDTYIQQCVDAFCAHVLPEVCKVCDNTRYVPVPGAVPPRWEACKACETKVPSTADVPRNSEVPTGTEVAT